MPAGEEALPARPAGVQLPLAGHAQLRQVPARQQSGAHVHGQRRRLREGACTRYPLNYFRRIYSGSSLPRRMRRIFLGGCAPWPSRNWALIGIRDLF